MNTRLVNAYRELEESHQLIEQQAKQLKELSIRDELTGLYNRRFFNEEAQLLLSNATRYQHPLAVILADIDHFKMINDNFSHAIGDRVLQQVSEILLREIPQQRSGCTLRPRRDGLYPAQHQPGQSHRDDGQNPPANRTAPLA